MTKSIFQYELEHISNTEKYASLLSGLYNQYIADLVELGMKSGYSDPNKPFLFSDYPRLKKKLAEISAIFAKSVNINIASGMASAWAMSNTKNSDFVASVFKSRVDTENIPKKYNQQNIQALRAFQNRKTGGLGLSDRVWNLTGQFQGEIELLLELELLSGKSARQIATQAKQYLKEPDKLFRRVRDEKGALRLSKNAKNYNPGQGVYRSSYQNALRLVRTEINMAYREVDFVRYNQLDFVVGFEVKRSNRFFECDICSSLKGKYPKSFKFVGWHPNCRCYSVAILCTEDEMQRLTNQIIDGQEPSLQKSKNGIYSTPKEFDDYVKQNRQRILNAKSLPYFVRDNVDFSSLKFAR